MGGAGVNRRPAADAASERWCPARHRFSETLTSCTETMMRNIVYDCADDDEDGVLLVPTRFVLRRVDADVDADDDNGATASAAGGADNNVRLSMPTREANPGTNDDDGSTGDPLDSGDSDIILTASSPTNTIALRRESSVHTMPWLRAVQPRSTTVVVTRGALMKEALHSLARKLVVNRPAHDTVHAARERMLDAIDIVLHARQQVLGLAGRVLRPDELGEDNFADLAASSTNITLRWRQVRSSSARWRARARAGGRSLTEAGGPRGRGADRESSDADAGKRFVRHRDPGDQPGHGRPDGGQDGDAAKDQRAPHRQQLCSVRPARGRLSHFRRGAYGTLTRNGRRAMRPA